MISNIAKKLFFLTVILIQLCGIGLFAIGYFLLTHVKDFEKLFKGNVYAIPYVCMCVGSAVFLTAFFGCCGAILKSYWTTITYATILVILIIIQSLMGAFLFVKADEGKTSVNKEFRKLWDLRKNNTKLFDSVQSKLECCGKDTPSDWGQNPPMSCCDGSNDTKKCTIAESFTKGCEAALDDFIELTKNIIALAVLGIAGVEFIGLLCSCCFSSNVFKRRERLILRKASVSDY